MPLNQLIAQGGTQIKSPIQRYMETRKQMENEKRNQLAMQAQQEQAILSSRNAQRNYDLKADNFTQNKLIQDETLALKKKSQGAEMAERYAKAVTPMIEIANRGETAEKKQETWTSMLPEVRKIAEQFNIQLDGNEGEWNQQKVDSVLLHSGTKNKVPSTRSVMRNGVKIWEEYDLRAKKWNEIGRDKSAGKSSGSAEFERLEAKRQKVGYDELSSWEQKRLGVLAGTDMRVIDEKRFADKERARTITLTKDSHDEYSKSIKHFGNMNVKINDALAAMDSGQNGLSETFLNQIMSQVQDTNVRAFQMYGEFDKSFGNVGERVVDGIHRFLSGTRDSNQRKLIRDTLEYYRDNYVKNSSVGVKNTYRKQAVAQGLNPFEVVPPTGTELDMAVEIRDFPHISKKEKMRLLEIYAPDVFRAK